MNDKILSITLKLYMHVKKQFLFSFLTVSALNIY